MPGIRGTDRCARAGEVEPGRQGEISADFISSAPPLPFSPSPKRPCYDDRSAALRPDTDCVGATHTGLPSAICR
jgi:hypothetical protein